MSRLEKTRQRRLLNRTLLISISVTFSLVVGGILGWVARDVFREDPSFFSPFIQQNSQVAREKPLQKYSFSNLSQTTITPADIKVIETIQDTPTHTSYLFSYSATGGTITGQLNVPQSLRTELVKDTATSLPTSLELASLTAQYPTIVMLRGYYPLESYTTGGGTRNAAAAFAEAGFITIAPDFLGYGGSDPELENSWEARFVRPLQVLELIEGITQNGIPVPNARDQIATMTPKKTELGMWGHSNGGHIAISVLQISGASMPTTLWAPVTAPFPYSVLYFGLEQADEGKAQRKWLSLLEEEYDVFDFSISHHMDRLQGPIQLHHGTADEAAPIAWSNAFRQRVLAENEERAAQTETEASSQSPSIDLTYFTYPGADHNMQPSWNIVVQRDIKFFTDNLKAAN